jgi:hypothetical protein
MDPEDAAQSRQVRPRAVTLASSILIATGALGIFAALAFARSLPAGAQVVFISTLVIGAGSITLGWLVRDGRAWLPAVTFAAALGFLDLVNTASPLSLILGLADVLVVGLLITNRAWFEAMHRWRAAIRADRRPKDPV